MEKKLENEYFKLRKELQQEQAANRMLRIELSELKEKVKDMKPTKSGEQIKTLKDTITGMENAIDQLHSRIYELEQEKKRMLQNEGIIPQSEYEELLKQLEREIQSKEQYQRLYEQEKTKRNELKTSLKAENKTNTSSCSPEEKEALLARINELENKLSRKGTAGKPRSHSTTDEDVFRLREEGKTIRQICQETGLSTATITKILKSH